MCVVASAVVRPARGPAALLAVALAFALGACGSQPGVHAWLFVPNLGAKNVSVFDGDSWAPLGAVALPGSPHEARAEPGAKRVWTANIDRNSVTVIDATRRRVIRSIPTCRQPTDVAFTARHAFVACGDGYMDSIDLATLRSTGRRAIGFAPHTAVAGPGGRVWVANRGSNDVSEVDAAGRLVARYPAGPYAYALAFSPDGKYLYVTSKKWSALVVLTTSDKTILGSIPVGTDPALVVASRDGRRVYVAGQGSNAVSVIDARTFQVIATVPVGRAPHGVSLSPDGRLLFVANSGPGSVSVLDTGSLRVIRTLSARAGANDVAIVPKG